MRQNLCRFGTPKVVIYITKTSCIINEVFIFAKEWDGISATACCIALTFSDPGFELLRQVMIVVSSLAGGGSRRERVRRAPPEPTQDSCLSGGPEACEGTSGEEVAVRVHCHSRVHCEEWGI